MRTRWILAPVLATLLLSACASEPETGEAAGQALLEAVAESMGGWDVLSSIERQELITQGNDWEPQQAVEPGAERQVNGFGRTVLVDYGRSAMRIDFDGERIYPNEAPVRFTEVINADIGALLSENPDGEVTASRVHGSRLAARIRDFIRLPRQLVFAARDASGLTRLDDQSINGQTIEILQFQVGPNPIEIHIDAFTKLPSSVIFTETDPLYGDTENAIQFLDWRESQVSATDEGVPINARLPYGQAVFLNGEKYREEAFRIVINNGTFDDGVLDIPQGVRAEPAFGEEVASQWTLRRAVLGFGYGGFAEADQTVNLDEVAPGVLHATGSSHHSLVIEMEDHVIVIGTPLFEERSLAVIAAIEEQFPDKPIRHAAVSHFHMDHSGGVRAYAATGATIVVHESVVDFFDGVMGRPMTVRSDSLTAASGVSPTIEGVGAEPMELTDGTRTVQLRHVPNDHASGMLMAYLPNERIAFVADLYSPGGTPNPEDANARAFYDAVEAAGIDIDQVVGGHGGVGPYLTLARAMATDD